MNGETLDPQTYSPAQAEGQLDRLVRRVADARERITITDQGQAAAVLISPRELADLEQALAVAEYRAQFVGMPAEQLKLSEVLGREGEER
jgi:PHD/YefM family antitoxin component YafN of YafNO toxin-antitoxin module